MLENMYRIMKKTVIPALLLTLSLPLATAEESIAKRELEVTMKGNPVTLLGTPLKVGDKAPDFKVVDGAFRKVKGSSFAGKVLLISTVPSLDTGICSLQTKRFNEEIARLPENVQALTLSADLPFAQKRFCEAEKVDQIQVLSDSVWRDFGRKFGLLIEDKGLLARSVMVIDSKGKIVYMEIVPEVASHPDYDKALAAVREAS